MFTLRRSLAASLLAAMGLIIISYHRISDLSTPRSGDCSALVVTDSKAALRPCLGEASAEISFAPSLHAAAHPSALNTVGARERLAKNITRGLVIPRTRKDDIAWMRDHLAGLDLTIYVADDATAQSHPPRNKGREVIVYLTYIIDHYDKLPDLVMFMHPHRHAEHNNDLLDFDAVQVIRRLQSDHVMRQGYVNLRCHWSPGCPRWLTPGAEREVLSKQEELVLTESWHELFPHKPLPSTLAQACCAQFAVSRERIHSISKGRFLFYRDWIMKTPLTDYISGRIWEYTWHFLFTSRDTFCPAEHICYCDGFGICFGGQEQYKAFRQLHLTKNGYESQLREVDAPGSSQEPTENRSHGETVSTGMPELRQEIDALERELIVRRQEAIVRGANPLQRASECGRAAPTM